MTEWNLIAGEDATLLYMYECDDCGTIIVEDQSSDDYLHKDSAFCPICEPQPTVPFLVVWTHSFIKSMPLIRKRIAVCREAGIVI